MITKKHPVFNSLIILTMLAAFMFHGCAKKDASILKKKTFAAVLTELMIIDKLGTDDTHKAALITAALDSFKITAEQFRATTERYKERPDFWLKVYKLAEGKITEKEKQLEAKRQKKK